MRLSEIIAAGVKRLTSSVSRDAASASEGARVQRADLSDDVLAYVRRGGAGNWCGTSFAIERGTTEEHLPPPLAPPMRMLPAELGDDPLSGRAIRVVIGRFGPFVTDGQTNASIPYAQQSQPLALDDAIELLQRRTPLSETRRRPRHRS